MDTASKSKPLKGNPGAKASKEGVGQGLGGGVGGVAVGQLASAKDWGGFRGFALIFWPIERRKPLGPEGRDAQ